VTWRIGQGGMQHLQHLRLLRKPMGQDPGAAVMAGEAAAEAARVKWWALAGLLVTLQQLEVTGTFLPDGRSLVGGDVRYVMDMRALAPMVDATDPNSVCAAAAQFDTTCSACPDSGEPYCLAFHLDHLEGTLVEDLVLDPVSGVNCEACEAAAPPADAVCE
jgi:hypothetical protein